MYIEYFKATKALTDVIHNTVKADEKDEKRSGLYLEWIYRKTELFNKERFALEIPDKIYPKEITCFAYNKNKSDIQIKINKYYNKSDNSDKYIRNSSPVETEDKLDLLHKLVLLRGNVVWVEFGFNIGCEFGGKHPAIILKNLGEVLIVAPLTSGTLTDPKSSEVIIEKVFNLPKRDRYTNITRITPVSIYRIDLNSPVGSIPSEKMKDIFTAIKNDWKL